MKEQWQEYCAKFAALTQREKRIVAAASVFGILYLGFVLAVDPSLNKARIAFKSMQQTRADAQAMQPLLVAVTTQNIDPDAANRNRLDQLKKQIVESGERVAKFQTTMVPPERMQGFLEGLLRQNRNLELVALKTLPAMSVGAVGALAVARKGVPVSGAEGGKDAQQADPAAAGRQPLPGIYQHGMEVVVAGSYNDLLAYLVELEKMPQRVMWNSVSLTATYPRSVLTLRVFTLSLDKNWLTV